MISKYRLGIDLLIQVLLLSLFLVFLFVDQTGWKLILGVLVGWQGLSAFEQLESYNYRIRQRHLALLISGFILLFWPGTPLLAILISLIFVAETFIDWRIVLKRPRSFWDLQ